MFRSVNNVGMHCEHYNKESWAELFEYCLEEGVVVTRNNNNLTVFVLMDEGNKNVISTMLVVNLGKFDNGYGEIFDEVVFYIDGKEMDDAMAIRKWYRLCRDRKAAVA